MILSCSSQNTQNMSFKKTLSIILLLAIQCHLFAQTDTSYQTIHQENGAYIAPLVETASDRLFRTRVPSNWMFKFNLAPSSGNDLHIGAEYKIAPAFSVGAYYGVGLGYNGLNGWQSTSSLAVEGRWYHDMKKRINDGRSANNFGGRYLALEGRMLSRRASEESWTDGRITLRYGLQQRFMRKGYFDISFGAGISNWLSVPNSATTFSTDQRFSVGLAAFLPRYKTAASSDNLCEVLHCQDEQYKMLKINLFGLLSIHSGAALNFFMLRPNVAFEHKIGRSPFAAELDVAARYQSGRFISADHRFAIAYWNATGELKWYYNMRKRILEGRSGNNLSGAFIGLQLHRNNLIKKAVSFGADGSLIYNDNMVTGDYWAGNLVWGIQQRVLERGFIQFKIGGGSTFGGHDYLYNRVDETFTKIGRQNQLNIVAEMKVGVAF